VDLLIAGYLHITDGAKSENMLYVGLDRAIRQFRKWLAWIVVLVKSGHVERCVKVFNVSILTAIIETISFQNCLIVRFAENVCAIFMHHVVITVYTIIRSS